MKKVILTTAAIAIALMSTGCNDEANQPEKNEKVRVIVLSPKVIDVCHKDIKKENIKETKAVTK